MIPGFAAQRKLVLRNFDCAWPKSPLTLNSVAGVAYCRLMKRLFYLLVALTVGGPIAYAQDAATEERLNKLSGQIEDLIAGANAQKKQLEALAREVDTVREQASKPAGNYASQEDLKRLADAVNVIDRKRLEDYEKIRAELLKLGKSFPGAQPAGKKKAGASDADVSDSGKPARPEKGFEYEIQKGDSLWIIVQAYREKNIKITTDQILKANPGLKEDKLRVGQKIFIPAPQN